MSGLLETDPVTLKNLLVSSNILPGDTIVLLDGEYNGDFIFSSLLSGTSDLPIMVKAKNRLKAKINGGFWLAMGNNIIFEDLEFTNTNWINRDNSDIVENPNIYIAGATNIKIRNCYIHDGNQCIVAYGGGLVELYGCLLGNGGSLTYGGHTIYTHNTPGFYTLIDNNIWLGSYNYGFHAHSCGANYIKNYHVKNNIFGKCNYKHTFGNDSGLVDAVQEIVFEDNENMNTWWWMNRWSNAAKNIIVRNNWFDGYGTNLEDVNAGCCSFKEFAQIDCYGNTFVNESGRLVRVKWPAETMYDFHDNTYYGTDQIGTFMGQGDVMQDWSAWNVEIDDTNSTFNPYPPKNRTRVIPNIYNANLCHVGIYNYSLVDNIQVNVSGVFSSGDIVNVHQSQDYYNDMQQLEVSQGGIITIDMRAESHSVALPISAQEAIDPMMCPKYGAFVCEKQ